ncbi:DUF1330 domain-containing protein [Archangium violaceum]|uniref:DUF1330 domain-containing protein n=1 Tax=Archangium violaceum TaxID=83451 RepID=UPI0019523CF0|nr:DUF1330 domain-containing protein [Archangium violaceum]QRN98491.1 DUF1330 domain-containing protein [Archangium violaceum]
MKTKRSLLLAVLAGTSIGALPAMSLYAQAASAAKPPAFYISEFELTDAEGIRPYSAAVESTFAPFGGRYVVRGGKVTSLEGEPTKRIVMIAFPSMEQAQAWYDSPKYREIMPIRHRSAKSRVFIVEGVAK